MALAFNGMGPQNSGDSSKKSISINPGTKYQPPINSLMVVLPQLLGWLNSADIEHRRQAIGNTFARFTWAEVVAQAREVYTSKRRTLLIENEDAFMHQVSLIEYYHQAARNALTRHR
ncbi:MAG: hypothetical protein EOO89_21715 [Pedobacter sp.]|nr:MAG: hypothetical protein EOO89_21715 [Pedobacter sp.]